MQHTTCSTHTRTTFAIHIRSRICCKLPAKATLPTTTTTIYGGRFFFICCQHSQGGEGSRRGGRVEGTCIFHELVHIKVKCTKRKRATERYSAQGGVPVGSVKAQFKTGKGTGRRGWGKGKGHCAACGPNQACGMKRRMGGKRLQQHINRFVAATNKTSQK